MYRHSLPELFPQLATRNYAGAAAVARRLLTLPTHHYLTHVDEASIVSIFQAEL
jgi:dTDP-4-amino-4,6-dideoxygalactose transaminase